MAYAHISFNDQTAHGRTLRRGLQQLEDGLDNLRDTLSTLEQMRDGDGSVAAHYARATTMFGTPDDTVTKNLYDELASFLFKMNTDASVTNVLAATNQLLAKTR